MPLTTHDSSVDAARAAFVGGSAHFNWAFQNVSLAFGWFNFAIGVATLLASLLFGVFYDRWGSLTVFGIGAGLSLAATIPLLWTTRKG